MSTMTMGTNVNIEHSDAHAHQVDIDPSVFSLRPPRPSAEAEWRQLSTNGAYAIGQWDGGDRGESG